MLNNAGITRIEITDRVSGRGAWRFASSRPLQPVANAMYRDAFAQMGMELMPGESVIQCTSEEFAAGYDKQYGTDLFLRFTSGMQASLQEKFLTTTYSTVTVEYYQDWRTQEPGDWFKLRVDYYFVGYHSTNPYFDRWILLDWPAVQRATSRGQINWQENRNKRDGARASFRYANFWDFPSGCVVGGYWEPHNPTAPIKQEPQQNDQEDFGCDDVALDVLAHQERYLYQTD